MEIEHCALHLHRGCPHRPADVFRVGEDVEELLQLIQPSDQMRLLSILSIRKGKRLIQRILPHLMNQEASIQILNCFINLPESCQRW